MKERSQHLVARPAPPRHLALLAVVLVVVVGALLVFISLGAQMMVSTQAYITAEGHYIKAQKDAVRYLERYIRTGDEHQWRAYQRRVAVPLADRRAREALQSHPPQPDVAAAAFEDALNHPDDAAAMVTLFPYSSVIEEMARAIEIWEAGDAEVERLVALANHVRERRLAGARVEDFEDEYHQLESLSARLDSLGVQFSASLNQGSRRIRGLVQWSVLGAAALLILISIGGAARVMARTRDRDDALRAMINHGHDLLALLAPDGRFLYANGSLERRFGWSPEKYPELTLQQFVGPAAAESVAHLMARGYASEGGVTESLEVLTCAGEPIEVELTLSQLPVTTSSRLLLVTARDVTEQRAMQSKAMAAQRMQSVGRLAGGIAHDFNNMLTAIMASAELGKRHVPKDHAAFLDFQMILDASKRSASLVSRLLQFASARPMAVHSLSWRELMAGAEPLVRRLVDERVNLTLVLPESPVMVRGNPTQLEQLLLNLVSNARDALVDGQGQIRVELRVTGEGESARAQLIVEDSGTGIHADIMDRIFDPFFTTKGPTEGTGLGLASCHGIVRQHDGTIEAKSELGRGARFTVDLPLDAEATASQQEAAAAVPAPVTQVRGAGRRQTLLYIEDEDVVRTSGVEILKRFGYDVLEAASGEQALELYAAHPREVSLVLSDVVLPGMQGVEILDALRERGAQMPFLFVSGYHESPTLRARMEGSNVSFLSKPYDMDQLRDALNALLPASATREEARAEPGEASR